MSANLAKDPNRRPEGGQLVLASQSLPAARDPYGLLAGYPSTGTETPSHSYLELILELWRIVYKRKWLDRQHRSCHPYNWHRAHSAEGAALYGNGSATD